MNDFDDRVLELLRNPHERAQYGARRQQLTQELVNARHRVTMDRLYEAVRQAVEKT